MPLFICQTCDAEYQGTEGKCPSCGGSATIRLAPNTDRMIDRVIKGKFKIVRKLGQGGMGAVYLAEQVGIGHRVAVKFLKAEFSNDPEIARRFINEAKVFGRVAHPNAVSLNEFGQDDEGNLYIAMEYCEGVDLKKVIAEQGRLAMVEGIDVVLQVADVLVNAHANGVVHRDLKPENIMIRRGIRGMHAKVLDFGIARLMDASTKLTLAGAIAGTPRYMSPEQVEGRPDVDHRADVYSLGVVLFEVLTGRQPFDGNTIAEILRKQATEPLPHLAAYAPDLDYPDLDAVLQRACAKRREARFPDMLMFASALSQAVPTQAHLGMSPLQRSSVHPVIATPAPGVQTALEAATATPHGVATVGMGVEGGDANTLLKTGQTNAVVRQPLATGPTALGTRTEQQAPPEPQPMPGDLSMSAPLTVPTSKAPMIAAIVVAVAVVGVGVAFVFSADPKPPPPEFVKAQDTVNPADAAPEPPQDPSNRADVAVLKHFADEQMAKQDFSNGQSLYDTHQLDNAEKYLKKVPSGSSIEGQASELLGKINKVRAALAAARAEFDRGHCELAAPFYSKVLTLNKDNPDALNGLKRCRDAAIDPMMP